MVSWWQRKRLCHQEEEKVSSMDTEDLNALADMFPYLKMTLHRISEFFSHVLEHLNELLSVTTAEKRTDYNETTLKKRGEKKGKSELRSLILDSWADFAAQFWNKWVKTTDGHEKEEEKLLTVSAELH